MMEQMDQGEVIIRPSSKGADHLTVTWKVTEGVYQHIDVREEGKENAFSLGQSLKIGNEEFEDLDEIIARHVNPMASHARDVMSFKYFKPLEVRQAAEDFLKSERERSANKIHYVLYAAKEYPGKFVLAYLPKSKVHLEYITIRPEGFKFRQQNFESLNLLFKWFKEHYRDPPPTVTPSATPTQARMMRTPYATPGNNDARSVVGGPTPSVFAGPGSVSAHVTPHYATPGQNYTPFSSYAPYTPTAQTPNMTPYQSTTPLPASQPQSGFIHPSSASVVGNVGVRSSQQRMPSKQSNNSGNELDWRKAAEAWAKQQQKGVGQPGFQHGYSGEGSRTPATRNAAQVISEGIEKTRQMSSSAHNYFPHKSPRTGHDSLKSTPKTNFSPRSMIESSVGDETPLYDEH